MMTLFQMAEPKLAIEIKFVTLYEISNCREILAACDAGVFRYSTPKSEQISDGK